MVKVATAALNFSDLLMIRGAYQVRPERPFIAGHEVAGTVVAAGPDTSFAIGDRIASTLVCGGFAETVAVPEHMMFRIPDAMPFDQAAALPVVYTTALIALRHRADLAKGETVLVHAAAGGAGLAAVQVARALGARVFATAGSPEKVQIARDNGAEAAFDYGSTDWVGAVRERTENAGSMSSSTPSAGTSHSPASAALRGAAGCWWSDSHRGRSRTSRRAGC